MYKGCMYICVMCTISVAFQRIGNVTTGPKMYSFIKVLIGYLTVVKSPKIKTDLKLHIHWMNLNIGRMQLFYVKIKNKYRK